MDDRDPLLDSLATGYLRIQGCGGLTTREMRELLVGMEDAYRAVARAEWIVTERLVALRRFQRWSRRWGPPELVPPWASSVALHSGESATSFEPDVPLVVSRVVLQSPGFWEFLGSLNPLEVTRKYLNDRHERRKDRDYRSAAEADRLALENALLGLDVLKRYRELEREYEATSGEAEVLRRYISGSVRGPLERLGQLDDRRLITGESATTNREQLPADEPPT